VGATIRRILPVHDRSGWKAIEFDKGKSAIVVLSQDKLPTIVDTLINAVPNGELDEQLNQSSKSPRPILSSRLA
jgi:hypothetical protein